jgi:hypothetical protein
MDKKGDAGLAVNFSRMIGIEVYVTTENAIYI